MQALVGRDQRLCRLVIENDAVNLTVFQGFHSVRRLAEGLDGAETGFLNVGRGIDKARGAGLRADDGVGAVRKQIIDRGDGAVVLDNDDLHAGGVGVGEVDLLLALVGHGHAGHAHVIFACLDAGDDRVKRDVRDLQLHAELVGDGLRDLNVDADDRVAVVVLIRREGGFGRHGQLGGFGSVGSWLVIFGSRGAGGKAQHQNDCKKQCGKLFHFRILHWCFEFVLISIHLSCIKINFFLHGKMHNIFAEKDVFAVIVYKTSRIQ